MALAMREYIKVNGTPSKHRANYRIKWGKKAPVCKGDLDKYPTCERPFNLSLIPGCDTCRDKKHHHGDEK